MTEQYPSKFVLSVKIKEVCKLNSNCYLKSFFLNKLSKFHCKILFSFSEMNVVQIIMLLMGHVKV